MTENFLNVLSKIALPLKPLEIFSCMRIIDR